MGKPWIVQYSCWNGPEVLRRGYNLPMLTPTITIHISGSAIAIYGAVLSTITAGVQVVTHLKDRVRLRVHVQHNMETIGGDPRYAQKKLTIMRVSNAGRRPTTVTCLGAYRLFPHNPFIIADIRPQCPCELTEGKELSAILNQEGLDLSVMESWEAYTATGGTFRLSVVPWYRRLWNRRKFRRAAMEKKQ
ncbi:MAG TPA: hypothetical protein VHM93_01715 [Candidatus Acidoferrum sp.]|jgi:hypothetical protein|nr:hypothetical protein [Candidatus Acidoferrum sp.]